MDKTSLINLTQSPDAAHCLLRLLAVTDEDTRRELGLNDQEIGALDDIYDVMAAAGVGGHVDGLTPEYRAAA